MVSSIGIKQICEGVNIVNWINSSTQLAAMSSYFMDLGEDLSLKNIARHLAKHSTIHVSLLL